MAKSTKPENTKIVGVDIGGTKILSLVTDAKGTVLGRAKRKTKPELGAEEVINRITKTIYESVADAGLKPKQVAAVGMGFPGPLDHKTGQVIDAPNMPGWRKVPLADRVSKILGVPVVLDNDVNLGTLGEVWLGAGRNSNCVVGIFIGTGIGGGIVLDGKVFRGRNGTAGEIGHLPMAADGPLCGCGQRGCLEAFSSRSAIARDIAGAVAEGASSCLTKFYEGDLSKLTSSPLKRAFKEKDKLVIGIVRDACRTLGRAVGGLINLLSPDVVVLGGGVMEAIGDFMLPEVERHSCAYAFPNAQAGLKLVQSELGGNACALGAACLALDLVVDGEKNKED